MKVEKVYNLLELIGKKVIDIKKDSDNTSNEAIRILFEYGYIIRIPRVIEGIELIKKDE